MEIKLIDNGVRICYIMQLNVLFHGNVSMVDQLSISNGIIIIKPIQIIHYSEKINDIQISNIHLRHNYFLELLLFLFVNDLS